MNQMLTLFLLGSLFLSAAPASSQEIVVTAQRRASAYAPVTTVSPMPAITLRRTADFAVQSVKVVGDTRDPGKRHDEIYAMIRNAIDLSGKYDVELATGDYVVEPLTVAGYRNLPLTEDDNRPDTQATTFLVKTRLARGMDAKAALDRITRFVAAVPAVGRAELETDGDMTLSVVKPEQYRGAIVDLIAADAAANAAKFGPGYGVQVSGLDRPVEWARAGLTEIFLYLPESYAVLPKP